MATTIEEFVLGRLSLAYPDAKSELIFHSPYQLSIAVMLSAQCTDRKVNEVTPSFFRRWPDFASLAKARLTAVETAIRPVNYYKTKAKHLLATAQLVISSHGGKLPSTLEELLELPGIGRKTASVILCELGLEQTLPVDTHVYRVSKRLGLSDGNSPVQVENDLRERFKSRDWRRLHHLLILHGRRVCKAQHPMCKECPLLKRCPHGKKLTRTGAALPRQ